MKLPVTCKPTVVICGQTERSNVPFSSLCNSLPAQRPNIDQFFAGITPTPLCPPLHHSLIHLKAPRARDSIHLLLFHKLFTVTNSTCRCIPPRNSKGSVAIFSNSHSLESYSNQRITDFPGYL